MTAAIADHKLDVYDSGGEACGQVRNVQIDHHAASAVGFDLVGAGFLPWRREVVAREVVAAVITLGEIAPAVEYLDPGHNPRRTIRKIWWSVSRDAEGVFALQRRVRAPEIVCSGEAAQRRHGDHGDQGSFENPSAHFSISPCVRGMRQGSFRPGTERVPIPAGGSIKRR